MIGYYVHHVGAGHLHRAQAVAAHWRSVHGEEVTGLSSAARPPAWDGPWVRLPYDDAPGEPVDPTIGGLMHWAPLGSGGLRQRMAGIASWVGTASPRAVVVDVSAEVAVLVRLLGVPVVTVVLPGVRSDAAHLTGFRASSALVACWPPEAGTHGPSTMTPGLPDDVRDRIEPVGAISRFPTRDAARARRAGRRRGVLLHGRGGAPDPILGRAALERRLPAWDWTVLGGAGEWLEDPSRVLADADVVVTSAGQGSVADVAALRRPAVVVAEPRPHDEQVTSARVLAEGPWPAVVATSLDDALATEVLDRAATLPGPTWRGWVDGHAVDRFAAVVARVALPPVSLHRPREREQVLR